MSCEEVREQALVDEPDSAHLRECAECAAFVRDAERLHDVLGSLMEAPPERVWARIAEGRPHPARRRTMTRWLATAAGFAAVAAALVWSGPTPVPLPSPTPLAVRTSAPPANMVPHSDIDADLESARAEIEWLDRDIQRL